jgi:HD-GYP domain-containing protein (c-di-GMP phosphodiesterase class II)
MTTDHSRFAPPPPPEPPPPPPPPAARSNVDESMREQGTQLVMLISAVIRIGRAYSVTNQVFRNQLANIAAALRPVLDATGEAVFVVLHSDLYLNGVRVPVSASNFRFHQTVMDAFKSRGIAGIRVERGVAPEELAKFFDLFLRPNSPHGVALLKACADVNLQRILPAIHASTEPGGDDDPDLIAEGGEGDPDAAARQRVFNETPKAAAKKQVAQAFDGARSLLTTTSLSNGLEMRRAKRVVQPLVDGAFATEPIVVGLTTLHEHDEYTYAHAVNVCAIAVTMGHHLGLDRKALADIGVAALLHDVGKDVVGQQIFHPLEAFTAEEREAAERHPLEGARLIAQSTTLNATTLRCIRVALEHHADPAGRCGYPLFTPGWRTSLLSQIVSVADCYVNLHSRRGDLLEHITPFEALGMILGPLSHRFEPALRWALVQTLGFYPPGQLVRLLDGSVARVLSPNPKDLARPNVQVVINAAGRRLPPEQMKELAPLPRDLAVHRPVRGHELTDDGPKRSAA